MRALLRLQQHSADQTIGETFDLAAAFLTVAASAAGAVADDEVTASGH